MNTCRVRFANIAWLLFFTTIAIVMMIPLLFMFSTSLKVEADVYKYPIRLLPERITFDNYHALFSRPEIPMLRWFANSFWVTFIATALVLLIDSITAFGFSRLDIPWKRPIFVFVLITMMVPFPATLIPVYILLQKLHWLNTYKALIIPGLAGPFGVFLLKQFFDTIPKELEEAATLDGCSKFQLFWHVVLPVSKSVIATLGVFVFMGTWNAFLWPLIATHSIEMRTLPVGLTLFNGEYWAERGLVMSGAMVCAIPVIIAFLLFQRHIVRGIALSGMKV